MTGAGGLRLLEDRIWAELAQAPRDREHGWRTPVLATVAADGAPSARTVVLRDADADARTLAIFTDVRSPKVGEIAAEPRASLVFWSDSLQWQLRVAARVVVQREGVAVALAWDRISRSAGAREYLSHAAPGAFLHAEAPPAIEGHHFAILRAHVLAMDSLELHSDGPHRRVQFTRDAASERVP
ncbi:hypothetical protein FN976_25335 [Caenimonas sedimenti]|uniref:Pyridoxamine 5'-phosphate oxidase Alr4036 family FMN-binding domain-containing protein n=1 Tax=Caenimonas sedimenti TaxID=2596921 RepID=A0A562ZH55_9BURK|nr:pyridoxamine 5'-phosphate oxidase family protein [Caenimonas sedimenti]TWO67717.1 hypothetical protein FN976_25335 [Caenimonas sedimenti]